MRFENQVRPAGPPPEKNKSRFSELCLYFRL
ncbi:Uncharacterised protein [Bordetella pertussis]|nr:Uncharacterised protein [Bordetella pertussis]